MCVRPSSRTRLFGRLSLLFGCAVFAVPGGGLGREFQAASMVSLLANCQQFDSKVVYTTGVAAIGFEEQSLCLTSELAGVDSLSCLWLEIARSPGPPPRGISNGALISVQGEVSCQQKGHLGGYAGTIWDLDLIVNAKSGELLWQRPK